MGAITDWVWRCSLPGRRQRIVDHVLFSAYLLALASVVLTNSYSLPEKLLHWLVLPAFLGSLISSFKAARILETARRLAGSYILRAFVVYLIVLMVSTDASRGMLPAEGRSMYQYLRWGAGLLLFLTVTAHLVKSYAQFLRSFFVAMVAMLAVNAIVNIVPHIPVFVSDYSERLVATFGTPSYRNSTHVAPLFALYAMAAFGLAVSDRLSLWQKSIVGLSVPILFAGILLTQSRSALLALAVATVPLAATSSRLLGLGILATFCLCGGAIWLVPELREALLARGLSFRLELWKAYLELARIHPLSGYGLDRQLLVAVGQSGFEQPHNTLIWSQARGGIVASLAAVSMLLGSLMAAFAYWRRGKTIAPLLLISMLVVVSITEIGFLIYPFGWLWLVFWLPIGIGAGLEVATRAQRLAENDHPVARAR